MHVYEIRGIEEEAGVTTSIPIKAHTEEEAIREAEREGIQGAHVVGRHGLSPEEMEQGVEMRSNELIDKTGPTLRKPVMFGWVLLLFVLPAFVTLVNWVGAAYGIANNSVFIIDAIGVFVIVLLSVMLFGQFWGKGKRHRHQGS